MDYIEILAGKVALPDRMQCSLDHFALRLSVAIEHEQSKPSPDNTLIALLCDAARLGWEYSATMKVIICGGYQPETTK